MWHKLAVLSFVLYQQVILIVLKFMADYVKLKKYIVLNCTYNLCGFDQGERKTEAVEWIKILFQIF